MKRLMQENINVTFESLFNDVKEYIEEWIKSDSNEVELFMNNILVETVIEKGLDFHQEFAMSECIEGVIHYKIPYRNLNKKIIINLSKLENKVYLRKELR